MNKTGTGCGVITPFGQACGKTPIVGTVTLRDRLVSGQVLCCDEHKADRNRHAGTECGVITGLVGNACGKTPIVGTITLRDRLVAGQVLCCDKHKADYNRRAAELRATLKK